MDSSETDINICTSSLSPQAVTIPFSEKDPFGTRETKKNVEDKVHEPPKSSRHNIILCFLVFTVTGIADSVWSTTIIVAFVSIMTGKNSYVGYVEATQGMVQLITALPVGYVADKYSKSMVVRVGGCVLFLASGVTSVAVVHGERGHSETSFYLLIFALALWGLVSGINTGPLQALFADSIPQGDRSKYYVVLFACSTLSSCAGPALTIAIFSLTNDRWHLKELSNIVVVGVSMEVVGGVLMMFFDDKKTIADTNKEEKAEIKVRNIPGAKYIPYIQFTSSLVFALGSGMTVKFFPLFFKDDCSLSPMWVQAIYVIVPVGMVAMSVLAQRTSRLIGRVPAILICWTCGVACLFAMVFVDKNPSWRIVVPLYIARSSVINCTYPLEESILMDFVPKEQRARWKSLESVSSFGWCGSAALGGVLADRHGFAFTFVITACVQATATLLFLPLLFIVPLKEKVDIDQEERTVLLDEQ